LHVPPPGQLNLERLWWVDLANRSQNTYREVWLHGEVHEATRGPVYRANSNKFDLPPGRTTKRYRDIRIQDQWHARGYEVFIARSGRLPAGDYEFIVWLEPDLGSDTVRFTVADPAPPRLLSPRRGDSLELDPVFSWTRPRNWSGGITYTLRVVEVLPGQGEEEALRANRPWFEKRGLRGTSLRYPTSARRLEKNKRYAWEVKAEFGRGVRAQVSEQWGFSRFQLRRQVVVQGPLGITREVVRYGNWYRVELRIVNNSSAPVSNIVVTDSSRYFQCIGEAQVRKPPLPGGQLPPDLFQWLPVTNGVLSGGNGFASAIEMDLGSWTLAPGRTVQLRYPVVPIIHNGQASGGKYQAAGGGPVPMLLSGAVIGVQLRVCFSMNDDQHCKTYPGKAAAMSALVSEALTSADYLLVTVPRRLFALHDSAAVVKLLVTTGKLAKAKNGVLGYSEEIGHYELYQVLSPNGKWALRMNQAWAMTGYLLLVGEGDVVPHWPTLHNVPDRPIRYSDHMFSNMNWITCEPRLKVGRIVGRTAADLEIGIQNSLDVYYHTGGASYSGVNGWMATGIEVPHKGDNFTLQGEQGAKYLRDNKGMTCVVWGQEFITTRDRVLEKALRHKGRDAGGAHVNPDSSNLNPFSLNQLAAWLLEITVGLPPPHSGDQAFTDSEGRPRRVPYGFDSGDVAQAGHQAEDIENARRGGYPKAYIYAADWNGANGLIDNVFARDLPKHDVCFWSAHGNYGLFNALDASDVAAMDLRKHKRRPVVVSFGCYNGAYFSGNSDGIVRAYLKSGGGAFFGYTEMTSTGWFRDEVGDPYRFVQYWHTNRRMGIIMRDWKAELSVTQAAHSGDRRMLFGTNLYGDPKFGGD
ncbi:MAG: C25 family cysteine peptidase, partial [bacterium]